MRHGLSASLDLAPFVWQSNCRTGRPKYGVLKVRKIKKRIRQPLVHFKPYFGRAVIVPLPLCPWYFKGVVMYARYWFRYVARAGVGAALLRLLRVCQAVLLWVTPGALGSVWLFNGRTGELPEKATLNLRCESRRMLLRTEGAFSVSVDRNYSSRAWHLELEICIVRHRIELCECSSSEQGVITTAKRDYIED